MTLARHAPSALLPFAERTLRALSAGRTAPRSAALGSVLAIVLLSFWPTHARAHPTGSSFRLGLGLPALSVTHYPEPDLTSVTYGLYPITFGLHLGVQVRGDIGFAVHVLGGGQYDTAPGLERHIVYFSAAPRFEYMFTPHGTVAPYLGAELGVDVSGDTRGDLQDVFRTGGFFGLHVFAETVLSIDLELAANFLYDVDADRAGVRAVLYVSTTGWLR